MKYIFKNNEGIPYNNISLEVDEPKNYYEQLVNDKIYDELKDTLNYVIDNILNGLYLETPNGIIFNPNKVFTINDLKNIINKNTHQG